MITKNFQADLARELARKYHASQFRRDGVTPYFTHLEKTVSYLWGAEDIVEAAGWLHDVIEDGHCTSFDLLEAGILQVVIDAVLLLTKTKGIDLDSYYTQINGNKIARAVKIADMLANLSDSPSTKQITRYNKYLQYLTDDNIIFTVTSCAGNPKHDSRCFGFFREFDEALSAVLTNNGGMQECIYSHIVIESICSGIHSMAHQVQWFEWNDREWLKIKDAPEFAKGVCNYCFG